MPAKIKVYQNLVEKLVLDILMKVWSHTFNADRCACLTTQVLIGCLIQNACLIGLNK